jgi:hypothetical protein
LQILQEFKFMFPEKENKLLQHWDQMRTVIMDVTVERDQWRQHPDIRRFIENYINKGDNDSDAEDYGNFILFYISLIYFYL